jgi:hypothetical protein
MPRTDPSFLIGNKEIGGLPSENSLSADHRAKQSSYVPILRLMLERVLHDVHLTYSIGQGR